ncbi:MAG: HEAT repeat domain-containing protein [Aureliella sp.]
MPAGDCFFRLTVELGSVEQASITITADDAYALYLNGRQIGSGNSIQQMEQYDLSRLLRRGRNVFAIRARNAAPGPAAVAARVFVKPSGKGWVSYSTSAAWRTQIEPSAGWQGLSFNDSSWLPAHALGQLGETAPWDRREEVSPERLSENQRFRISREFAVDEILGNDVTGSLINIAFNEFGHIIAAQEAGPLLLIYDSDKDGIVDKTREYCTLVDGIQGILPLNGDVYVTGTGPEGPGIYRLIDEDRNGNLEEAEKVIGFKGEGAEHGAHGLALGPDGRIYCVLGNQAAYDGEFVESSPLQNYYEGDLVGPRFEDPGGHAYNVKAPGGTIIRLDTQGEEVELVAGGLRNAYDISFHPSGRLFVHDSDMESDEGAVWYRPTSLFEVVEGSEYGWRSGWAKWPSYYYDRLPALLETGRGSPTGSCVYDHHMMPQRYHGALFLADWTQGQILCVRLDDDGGAQSEVFLQGQPLNVTDVTVGPDGWLYFCTGGRGTKGGIYQVKWRGTVPESVRDLGDGIAKAIRQPQLDAAWSRQEIASLKRELGSGWSDAVAGVAFSDENKSAYRIRALDLMQLFGPTPTPELLSALSRSANELVRAKTAQLMALHPENDDVINDLVLMLEDRATVVQQAACEALLRADVALPFENITPLFESKDRRITWAARRLLEKSPTVQWRSQLLTDESPRVRLQAGLALMVADPTEENALKIVSMAEEMLDGFISDRDFMDLLRLTQVTLHRTQLTSEKIPSLAKVLASEFPVGEPVLNRELIRCLAYLDAKEIIPEAISYIQSDAALAERLHIAMHLSFFSHDWTPDQRYALIKFFEETQPAESGSSVPLYVMNVTRQLCEDLPLEEARIFVSEGAKWPNAALVSLYRYPEKLGASDLRTLMKLDREIDREGYDGEQYKRLRTGIVAMLSQDGSEKSMDYLREIWVRSPERRQAIALGLSQQPNDENWDYLIRSMPVLESYAVTEVMAALMKVPHATDDPRAFREVIMHGLRMEQDGATAAPALKLLAYWTGEQKDAPDAAGKLAQWQQWYAEEFPNEPSAELPVLETASPWSMDTLSEYFLSSDGRKGSHSAGAVVYEKAQCADCHRMGSIGKSLGPDLTTVASRFTRKEVIESILYPSHIVSDQYRTTNVLTLDGRVVKGMLTRQPDGSLLVRDSELVEHVIAQQDVDEIQPSKKSLMPSGLIDQLTSAEIRDLMTYLGYLPSQKEDIANAPQTVR